MQGYQFAHMETWSRSGRAKQKDSTGKVRHNGQRGWTPEQILEEAERLPSAWEHVGLNREAPTVIPGTCSTFDELSEAHDEACNVKVSFPYTDRKTGKKKTRRRAVRKDSHTLYSAVFSLPITSEEAQRDPKMMQECLDVLDLALEFEKRRLEDAGGELAMGVVHLDEKHVHLHLYGLDRKRGSVNALHPGKAANDDFRARHGALSKSGTNLFEKSKRAYCDAMREWQDDLHREVFGRAGLLRYGPRRSRLSRQEYSQRKLEEEERATAKKAIGTASEMRKHLDAAAEAVAASEDNVVEEQNALQAERIALEEKRRRLDGQEDRLDAGLATVEAMAEELLEQREETDGRITTRQTKDAPQHPLWQQLRKRLGRAPQEVGRIGAIMFASLERVRMRAVHEGRIVARRDARAELSEQYSGIGAVHSFARKLIARLRSPEERRQANEELKQAAISASNDRARMDREQRRAAPGDELHGD